MRGIFSSLCGVRRPRCRAPLRGLTRSISLIGLALLLVQAAAAQNVTIDLTPITYPIVLPDSGGSFDYLLTVTNQGSSPITATIWCKATLPNGSFWGPVVGPATQTLGAGQTQSYHRTQNVPPRAAYGYYTLHAYVGIYPDTIWAQDQFEFQRQGISGTEQVWAARYNGPGNGDDEATSLIADGGGNVYVTGYSYGNGTRDDYATIKYNASGNQIWVSRYNGPGNAYDDAYCLAVDGSGNVYVTGKSRGNGTDDDYATVKYDSSGNQIWVARYNGPGNAGDCAYAIALDGGGNVYVTGESCGDGTDADYATVKYDSMGDQIWVARYNGPGNYEDMALALVVDSDRNVYITGRSNGIGTNADCATIRYDSEGNEIWVARYNGPTSSYDMAHSMALDESGNIFITGWSFGEVSNEDWITIKYDANGNQVWVASYLGLGNSSDYTSAIAQDNNGNIYVTGRTDGIWTNADYTTVKYDADGDQIWVARYNGPESSYDHAYSLSIDGSGNVFVTGESMGSGTNRDWATIKYDQSGNQLWVARYNGLENAWDRASTIAVDSNGNAFVAGGSQKSWAGFDFCTIKYSGGSIANPPFGGPVEATVLGQPLPQVCRLEGNYPNPFNATTALSFQLSANSYVHLRVYDTAGRLVETLVDGWRAAGEHQLTWEAGDLAAGMYFAKMQAGDYVGVTKLILLK